MQTTASTPRLSSTIVIVRDAPTGLQVLLLKRADKDDANGGAWVFPGGLVDAADALLVGSDTSLGVEAVTAVRECFEECGLLFAQDASGQDVDAAAVAPWQSWREPLNRGERHLQDLLQATGWRVHASAMTPLARWITPVGMRKRFDTRFFMARAPHDQSVSVDGAETVEHRWAHACDVLAQGAAMKLMTPTRKTLEMLAQCANVEQALAKARALASDEPIIPRLGRDRRGTRPVTPDELSYVEIGRLDPTGKGDVACFIEPGVAVQLSPRLIRVTAPNPGVMTGPGTNSYLVGGGPANGWAAIDPGPNLPDHMKALLAAAPGPIRWIFVTHTHLDHSPLASRLREATGAKVYGCVAAHPMWQDEGFAPDVLLQGGEVIALEDCNATLRVVHTPGHASNHLCYRLEEEAMLFTGDHVMQKSTVVINPPDGDMAAYVGSLQWLAQQHGDLLWLAPGHGFLMDQPKPAFEAIVAHRLRREAKVLEALKSFGSAPLIKLVARVYDDVPQALHAVAERSLTAHLLKLQAESRARLLEGDVWASG